MLASLPPLLPRIFPRGKQAGPYEALIEMLAARRVSLPAASSLFMFPGLGFHVTMYNMVVMLAEYRVGGQYTYLLPPAEQEILRKASLSGIEPRDLLEKLPHRALYIGLPESDQMIWGGPETQWHEVRGILVYHHNQEQGRVDPVTRQWVPGSIVPGTQYGALDIYVWGPENSKSRMPGDDACFWFSIDLQKIHDRGLCLQEYLDKHFEEVFSPASREGADSQRILLTFPEGAVRAILIENLRSLAHLVLGTLILLQSPDRQEVLETGTQKAQTARKESQQALERLKSEGKRKKVQQRLERLPADTLTWLQIPCKLGKHWGPNRKIARSKTVKVREEMASLRDQAGRLEAHLKDPELKSAKVSGFLSGFLSLKEDLAQLSQDLEREEAVSKTPLCLMQEETC